MNRPDAPAMQPDQSVAKNLLFGEILEQNLFPYPAMRARDQEMLGLMWLSRAIKDGGHHTTDLFIPDKDWLDKIKAYDPDVVCFSVTTGMHLYFADINSLSLFY